MLAHREFILMVMQGQQGGLQTPQLLPLIEELIQAQLRGNLLTGVVAVAVPHQAVGPLEVTAQVQAVAALVAVAVAQEVAAEGRHLVEEVVPVAQDND